jgi:hypothetical protein
MNELRKKMNSHGLGLVGYFIHENRRLLSLFALGPKKLQDGPGASLLKAVLQRSARIFDGQVLPPL